MTGLGETFSKSSVSVTQKLRNCFYILFRDVSFHCTHSATESLKFGGRNIFSIQNDFSNADMLWKVTVVVWSIIFTQNPYLWLSLDLDAATAVQLFFAETFKSAHKFLSFAKRTIND